MRAKTIDQILRENPDPRSTSTTGSPSVTATIMPASKEVIERRVIELENRVSALTDKLREGESPTTNKEGLDIGIVLRGESRGQAYTLEVLEDGYLCSNGEIYPSLSAAALGVSGNRRSGWKFWRNVEGESIGDVTGRFQAYAEVRQ